MGFCKFRDLEPRTHIGASLKILAIPQELRDDLGFYIPPRALLDRVIVSEIVATTATLEVWCRRLVDIPQPPVETYTVFYFKTPVNQDWTCKTLGE
jgi:hypothetical protein